MTALQRNHRQELLRVLRLLASRDEQLRYQSAVPYVPVSVELFCRWDACYGPRHHAWFLDVHSPPELAALDDFQRVITSVRSDLPERLPPIEDFVTMPQWQRFASGAAAALAKIESSHDATSA